MEQNSFKNEKERQDSVKIMKKELELLELKARYWESQWKIKHFTLENDKLDTTYQKFIDDKQREFIQEMQKAQNNTNVDSGIVLPTLQEVEKVKESVNS